MDRLSWSLCQSACWSIKSQTEAVKQLTANLDHHNSSIRNWMMEIGWFVVPFLNHVEATALLLKNLADTLVGPLRAAGLAARFFENDGLFFLFAESFKPPDSFEAQYRDRLKYVKENGIQTSQAPFWKTEASCRKEIERSALGFRKAAGREGRGA